MGLLDIHHSHPPAPGYHVECLSSRRWWSPLYLLSEALLDVICNPAESFGITCAVLREHCIENSYRPWISPCRITTLHMKTSMGLTPSSCTLPLPVVCHKPSSCLSCSSLIASGWSILFPRMAKGTLLKSSIVSRASSSAFDSAKRSWSLASTKNTMPETSGK